MLLMKTLLRKKEFQSFLVIVFPLLSSFTEQFQHSIQKELLGINL